MDKRLQPPFFKKGDVGINTNYIGLTLTSIVAFDSIHRGIMEQILLSYGLPKESVNDIMRLYKNTKAKVKSSDGDTKYFDIVMGVLQENSLALYLLIICIGYVLRTLLHLIKPILLGKV